MKADLHPYFRARLSPDERAEILSAEPRTASMVGMYDTRRHAYVVRIARAVPDRVLTGAHATSPIEAFRLAVASAEAPEIVSVLRG